MKVKVSNHFNESVILIKDGVATDTGCCTWHDDDRIEVEFEEGEVQVFSRYGDEREDDPLPPITATIGLRQFAQEIADIRVTINGTLKPWVKN